MKNYEFKNPVNSVVKNITPIGQNFGWVIIDSIPRPFLKYSRIGAGLFEVTIPSGKKYKVTWDKIKAWPAGQKLDIRHKKSED